MANKSDVFQRLIGLETEYALHVPARPDGKLDNRYEFYLVVANALRRLVPTVAARHMKEGVFHAGGGAVWFETERPADGGGLLEGATPECRSPRQLLAHQRAQDAFLSEAVKQSLGNKQICLLKNDRDARGNVYGSQENYEAVLATGWQLGVWRILLVAMLPIVILSWALLWLLAASVVLYTLIASVVYLTWERLRGPAPRLARGLFGCSFEDLGHAAPTGPRWLEGVLSLVTRVLTAPLAIALYGAVRWLAFSKIRREMLPFLLSRPLIAGSGMLDDQGRFHLADKAPAMNCLVGFGGLISDRPIFSFGHFFKTIYADAWLNPREYCRLFSPRQRLQIALGDSNLAELSEYLRVGTTLLVLDCIEAGEMPKPPRIRRPLAALRAFCADPTLAAAVPLPGGERCTALALQRFYLDGCRRFLARRPEAPAEAREILRRWEEALDLLTEDPQALVGSLDWVTKQWLLEKTGRNTSRAARKKIDLKYHELSPDGYFERLRTTGLVVSVLSPDEISHARRNPPLGTPATVRGRYIREFAGGEEPVAANWQAVYIGQGRRTKVIRLADYSLTVSEEPPAKDQRVEQF